MHLLSEQLYTYNVSHIGIDDGRALAVLLRDSQGQLVGGLHGWTWAGMAYIAIFWVTEALRGQGYGTQILLAAEQEARARGCDRIWPNSYSFQASEFCQQRSYTVFSVREDFPRQHAGTFSKRPYETGVAQQRSNPVWELEAHDAVAQKQNKVAARGHKGSQ